MVAKRRSVRLVSALLELLLELLRLPLSDLDRSDGVSICFPEFDWPIAHILS